MESVGHVPQGFPSLILPDLSLAEGLWPGALGIALMSFTETMAAGRAFTRGDEPTPRGSRELFATGLGNACGAFLGAMPSGGGTTQTAVNRLAGARTQLAELVTAGGTLLVMLFLAPLIGLMPQATLAAVVIVYSVGLIKPAEFAAILRIRRLEFIWAVVAFAGVVLVGTLKGILVAIVVSVVGLAFQVADPPVHVLARKRGTNVFRPLSKEHPDDETFPVIQRTTGGNLADVLNKIAAVMRARARTVREIVILSAEMRLSARVLIALPFVVAGALTLLNPGYLTVLFKSPVGKVIIGIQLLLMLFGYLVIRRMVNFRI